MAQFRNCRRCPVHDQVGFTLVEVAVVVLLVTLLLGSILVPLNTQVQQRQTSETQKQLVEFKETMIGFALQYGYLPCPDKTGGGGAGTANDGAEDVKGDGTCETNEGNLPWQTLGFPGIDLWGNRYRYRVTPEFATRPPGSRFTLSTAGNLTVCSAAPPSCSGAAVLTSTAPAVILSHGRNGRGGFNANSGNQNPLPASANELENSDGDTTFVDRPPSDIGSGAGEYDDLVSWLATGLLMSRMVAAGQLP